MAAAALTAAVLATTATACDADAPAGQASSAARASGGPKGEEAEREAARAVVLAEMAAAVASTDLEGAPPFDSEHLRAQRTAGGWCLADWTTQTPATDAAVDAVAAALVTRGWKAGTWRPKGAERISGLTKGEWILQIVHRDTPGDEYLSLLALRDGPLCPAADQPGF
ncbi:hypothetical protein [Streptomyces sp. cmx-4-9]|uniref:hypothetical protein n=1 Tax=Streptomyces sp. cmx-4-9 TaxID=2790941 RepID=UPI00397F4BA7